MPQHQKQVRHYHQLGDCHELTFSCYKRLPLLDNVEFMRMLGHSVNQAMKVCNFRLIAFVFMPEHVHLVVYRGSAESRVNRLLWAIKRPFSYRAKISLSATAPQRLEDLTIRERPGVKVFRFWQEGGGYDRNLTSSQAVLAAMEYIHLNPVRRGLCQHAIDWKWSSARHYFAPDRVDPDLLEIHPLPAEYLA